MTNSVGSMTSRRGRRSVWLRRRLVAVWPFSRVALQVGVGVATLTQHEAIVLTFSGVATLLEIVQDRYTACRQDCPYFDDRIHRRHPATADDHPARLTHNGDPFPGQELDTPTAVQSVTNSRP
jgi:hypothetical protein